MTTWAEAISIAAYAYEVGKRDEITIEVTLSVSGIIIKGTRSGSHGLTRRAGRIVEYDLAAHPEAGAIEAINATSRELMG